MLNPTIIEHQEKIGVGVVSIAGVDRMLNDVKSLSADWFYNWSPGMPANDVAGWYVGSGAHTVSDGAGSALRMSGAEGWAAQTVKVSGGSPLTISFDADLLAGSGGVVVEYRDAAGKVISSSFAQIEGSAQHYSISAVTAPPVVEARVVAYTTPAGQLEVDNFELSVGATSRLVNGDFEAKASGGSLDSFVPMVGSASQMKDLASIANAHPGEALLTFNEPDNAAQANMTVAQALSYWPTLMKSGMRLGSPAVTVGSTLGPDSWLGKFMTGADAKGYRVDFVAVHYYTTDMNVESFAKFLNSVHEAYDRPIWVTEWSLADWNNPDRFTAEQQAAFFTAATLMMDDMPFVERHAWYAAYEGLDSWFLNSGLIEDAGSLSAVGRAFEVLATADNSVVPVPETVAAPSPLGTDANDTLEGSDRDEVLSGLKGNDAIEGRVGADHIDGGPGVDTASYEHSASAVQVDLSLAVQKAGDAEGDVLTNIENVSGSSHDDVLKGSASANVLSGLGGDDRLVFSGGADTMDGGIGNDTADFSGAGRSIVANLETGSVLSSTGKVTLVEIENLTGTKHADTLTGNALTNALTGGAGNDTIDGGAGNDRMVGGLGDDLYIVDSLDDMVIEEMVQGFDTVRTSLIDYVLGANIEKLELTGLANSTGTGNELANTLTGNDGANVFNGLAGSDRLYGGNGNDALYGGDDGDLLYGGDGNDGLDGGLGNDTLDGGMGADTMQGGGGNDTYHVDDVSDIVTEDASSGTDKVRSSLIYYTLGDHVENLVLTGTGGQTGIGNALNNSMTGSSGVDVIIGGAGNDVLNGAAGPDSMDGGIGNDTFYVDDLGDIVLERAGEGSDAVRTSLTEYTLGDNVENLVLTGTGGQTGIGNALNNTIAGSGSADTLIGAAGNDRIDGRAGADLMNGGTGDDTFYVDDLGDDVVEHANEGKDTVRVSISGYTLTLDVENLTLAGRGDLAGSGNDLNNVLVGNSGANAMNGGAGDDQINGGAGADRLWGDDGDDVLLGGLDGDWLSGGVGKDVFKFAAGDSTPSNPDVIADFTLGVDIMNLSAIDANTNKSGNQAFSFLGTGAFSGIAGQLRYEEAVRADGQSYTLIQTDVDGDSVADFAIHLDGFTSLLSGANFML